MRKWTVLQVDFVLCSVQVLTQKQEFFLFLDFDFSKDHD